MRVFALCMLVLSCMACTDESTEPEKRIRPIKFSTITSATGVETHTFSGVAKAQNETILSFKVAGTLSSVDVELGEKVKRGQLIATINPIDYDIQMKQAISQKEGAVANAEAAESQLINAKATYERVTKLYENNSVALSEYQQAKASYDAAQAQYDAAIAQVSTSNQQVQAADNQIAYTQLVSPINGVITEVEVEANEMVNAGTAIATVSSVGRPEVEVGVPEILINSITKGQKVSITLPAAPGQTFQGIVDKVAYASGNAPTYPVIVEIDRSIEQIRPGMAANVSFFLTPTGAPPSANMIVPVEAVGKDNQGNFAFVLTEKGEQVYVAEKKAIVIGRLKPEGFELLQGLKEGERVAVAGLKSLMDGEEVKLLQD